MLIFSHIIVYRYSMDSPLLMAIVDQIYAKVHENGVSVSNPVSSYDPPSHIDFRDTVYDYEDPSRQFTYPALDVALSSPAFIEDLATVRSPLMNGYDG